MRRTVAIILTGIFLTSPALIMGCSKESRSPAEAATETDPIQVLQTELQAAKKAATPETRIQHLCNFYDQALALDGKWPDSEEARELSEVFQSQRAGIPPSAMRRSIKDRNLEVFKWAVDRSSEKDITYNDILQIWTMGKYWRDYIISAYPEQTLSILMLEAINDYSVRFFNQHLPEFAALGYKAAYPLQQTEFNTLFCSFYGTQLKIAVDSQYVDRIRFLIKYMPANHVIQFNHDALMNKTMEALSTYVIHELKDEALACQLIDLGYAMPRVDIDSLPLGEIFYQTLLKDPESAITHQLRLNEWHGPLSKNERDFVFSLSDEHLRLIHPMHLTEAIGAAIKEKNTEQAMRLIPAREEVQEMEPYEYNRFLGWALIYEDDTVYAYVNPKCRQVDIFRLELDELGSNWPLFRRLEPRIFRRIYSTMDTLPKKDGTTLGRIDVLFKSHNPQAVAHVVKKHSLEAAWNKHPQGGRTLLMSVSEGGNLEAAKYLIEEEDEDIRAHTDYQAIQVTVLGNSTPMEGRLTPLMFAAKGGHHELVSYLISKGANVNASSYFGVTPLMYAVGGNHLETAEVLLEKGADVNASLRMNPYRSTNNEDIAALRIRVGDTAYSMARDRKNDAMLSLLKKAGAQPR